MAEEVKIKIIGADFKKIDDFISEWEILDDKNELHIPYSDVCHHFEKGYYCLFLERLRNYISLYNYVLETKRDNDGSQIDIMENFENIVDDSFKQKKSSLSKIRKWVNGDGTVTGI